MLTLESTDWQWVVGFVRWAWEKVGRRQGEREKPSIQTTGADERAKWPR